MDWINEKTDYFVNITFKDEDGNLVIPTQAWYSLHCLATGTEVKAETEILTLDTTVEVIVSATENKIQDTNNDSEEKLMTVRFTYSGGQRQGTGEYKWGVWNLKKIT